MTEEFDSHFSDPAFLQTFFGSAFLGFRSFWKFSSVSKSFLSFRADTTASGFGGVTAGFAAVSEREEVWNLIDDCFARDDVRGLKQVLALSGVGGRYPLLLKRFLELRSSNSAIPPPCSHKPNKQECMQFLMQDRTTHSCSAELSVEAFENLSKERLSSTPIAGSLPG